MNQTSESAKEIVAEILLHLLKVESGSLMLGSSQKRLELQTDVILTAEKESGGYFKVPRTRGDEVMLGSRAYLGSRDGWIVQFFPMSDEAVSVNGTKIYAFEIPVSNLAKYFSIEHLKIIFDEIRSLFPNPSEIKPISETYKNDRRAGAWA